MRCSMSTTSTSCYTMKPMNKEHLEGTYYTNSEMTLNEFEFDKSQLVTLNEFDKSQCD